MIRASSRSKNKTAAIKETLITTDCLPYREVPHTDGIVMCVCSPANSAGVCFIKFMEFRGKTGVKREKKLRSKTDKSQMCCLWSPGSGQKKEEVNLFGIMQL